MIQAIAIKATRPIRESVCMFTSEGLLFTAPVVP
jgi:hypothetical protein